MALVSLKGLYYVLVAVVGTVLCYFLLTVDSINSRTITATIKTGLNIGYTHLGHDSTSTVQSSEPSPITSLKSSTVLSEPPPTTSLKSSTVHSSPQTDVHVNDYGYVMATHYLDQITGSTANVLSLQCWASTLGPRIRVVEPFLRHSMFGTNLYAASNLSTPYYDNNSVRRSDVLSKTKWDDFTSKRNFASLVNWEYFLQDAPRKLILLLKVTTFPEVNTKDFFQSASLFAEKYNFKIVRNVSVPQKIYPEKEFKTFVYGTYDPHDVVLIINVWGGVKTSNLNYRMGISGYNLRNCNREKFAHISIPLSSSIDNDAIKYTNMYLHSKGYISVMVRMEFFIMGHGSFKGKTKDQVFSVVMQCFNSLLKEIKAKKAQYGIDSVFLTMDTRKSGSKGFRANFTKYGIAEHVSNAFAINATTTLFHMLYGNSSTLEEWDQSFETVASHATPGYIAMLQKHLAAKGACLLLIGGGTFQSTAQQLYSQYHPNSPKCTYHIPQC